MAQFKTGRVNQPYHADVSHNSAWSSAKIYHFSPEGEKTLHDTMVSSSKNRKKDIISNIKKKYGSDTTYKEVNESAEYDIESMLEYIGELESQIEESLGADMLQGLKNSSNPKLAGAKKYNPEKKQGGSVSFKRGVADKDYDSDTRDTKSGKSYVESSKSVEDIESMLEYIMSGELVESKQSFADILGAKIAAKLSEAKIVIAQSIFGESKDKDDVDDKSDEVGEDEENKHPLIQLKKIASSEEGIPLKYPETVASGEPDKRSIRAATDRIKSGKSTSGVPTFKHKNGEESKIAPEHAQHIVNVLTGSAVKPDTKKAVLDKIHGSKAGLETIKNALGTGVVKNKSIYADDART